MPTVDLLIAFAAATAVFAYMPGPGMLYTAAQTIARGQRAGVSAAIGIHIGGYVHVIAASLGLTALFEIVPVAFLTLKFAGAIYLIWLGAKTLLLREPHAATAQNGAPKSARRAFWQSVAVEVLNPKTALFYVAFLPQFIDPDAAFSVWLQFAILGTFVNVAFSSGDVLAVMLADRLTRTFTRSAPITKWLQRLGGGILIGLGVKVALARS